MNFKKLLEEEDAVSPVIGVILMVAITVILAAVIASFVLGLGDQAQQTTPQASFSFDYNQGSTTDHSFGTNDEDGLLTITHEGGDSIDAARLNVVGATNNADVEVAADSGNDPQYTAGDDLSAGSTITIQVADGDTIRVTYTGESGDSSSTLATWEGPAA